MKRVADDGSVRDVMRSQKEDKSTLSRRDLFYGASLAIAAAAVPGWSLAQEANSSIHTFPAVSIMEQLSGYMAEARSRPLPADVIERTKEHILDTLAAMVSGSELPPARVAYSFARSYGGQTTATVVGSDLLCGPMEAALVNGMLAHSDETDDSHSPSHSHPGCAIVPAALASGELFGIDGQHLLRAVALGYDIGPRISMTLGGLQFQMKTHRSSHSIANTFGASVAAGCSASLSAQQMRWLLDYAAQQASGIAAWQRDTQHVEKSLVFGGLPARNGVNAALLIHLGATGVDDVFSGSDNFLMAFGPEANPAGLIEGLGKQFEVTQTNIKKWTVGSPIQAPLDALQAIQQKHPFRLDELAKVVVRIATSEAKTVNDRNMQDISLQQMMAVMLVDKTVSFRAAHDKARVEDPAIIRERGKIELVPDEQLERLYPQLVAVVEVTLHNGTTYTQRIDAVRGTVQNPMTREEVVAKCRDLMDPFLGGAQSKGLVDAVLNLDAVSNLGLLRPLLQRRK
jgi:2-methylcitrate dehydratase PrpD